MKLLGTILCLAGLQASADTFFVRDLKASGLSKDDATTVIELVRTSVETARHQLVENEKDAKFVLHPKILKLGSSYIVTLSKTRDNKTVYGTQLKAERFEELDNVVNRVVRSVISEVALAESGTVADVTENEAIKGTRRRDTVNRWYIGMGPAFVTNVRSTRGLFNLGIGYFFEIDPEWALKIVYEGSTRFNYLALGASHYFSQSGRTPLVTAELGYGSASIDTGSWFNREDETISNFVVGGGVGYQFFRTSKVNLEILLHGAVITGANHLGTPFKYGGRVGIYW